MRYLVGELAPLLRASSWAIGLTLAVHLICEAMVLILCCYALGLRLPPITLLVLYVLSVMVNLLNGLPFGMGLAEASLATLYTQVGIELEAAVAIVLAYRLTDYWLPRAAGGAFWAWLERVDARNRGAAEPVDGTG